MPQESTQGQTEFFSLGKVTNLGEWKLRIQTSFTPLRLKIDLVSQPTRELGKCVHLELHEGENLYFFILFCFVFVVFCFVLFVFCFVCFVLFEYLPTVLF